MFMPPAWNCAPYETIPDARPAPHHPVRRLVPHAALDRLAALALEVNHERLHGRRQDRHPARRYRQRPLLSRERRATSLRAGPRATQRRVSPYVEVACRLALREGGV